MNQQFYNRFLSSTQLIGAWVLAIIWVFPLLYMFWAAFHSGSDAIYFNLTSPLTLSNFSEAWQTAPFFRYIFNTFMIVTILLVLQLTVCTLAAYALARIEFKGRHVVFALILVQLMVMPEALIIENYRIIANMNLLDTYLGVALPYVSSAFGIFLLRQTFMQIPSELDEASQLEGLSRFKILLKVYIPLAKPTYLAYALVSISYHWSNFLWPLMVTNTEKSRSITVGLSLFGAPETGVDWGVLSAGTLISVAPLLALFILFQRHFVESFMTSGIK